MNFNDLTGQHKVVQSLKNSIDNKMTSHAYIFEGPVGIGKKTVAAIFASALVCLDKTDKPCNKCRSCVKSAHGNHPDIKQIKELETASIGIDIVRSLQKDIYIRPYEAERKVYIITEAERMTNQAQNGLLKILEEPPEYCVIILTVENSSRLLDTVLSRAVTIKFSNNTQREVEEFLTVNYSHLGDSIPVLSAFSGGIIGRAIDMASSADYKTMRKEVLSIFTKLIKEDELSVLDMMTFFIENKDKIEIILEMMLSVARDILIIKGVNNSKLLINIDMKFEIEALSHKVRSGVMEEVINIIIDTKRKTNRNVNYALAVEMMLIKSWEEVYGKRNWSSF